MIGLLPSAVCNMPATVRCRQQLFEANSGQLESVIISKGSKSNELLPGLAGMSMDETQV